MAVFMPAQVDAARNQLSRLVISHKWQIEKWMLDAATGDTLLSIYRWVDGTLEKCKLRLEYAAPLEDTLKRVAVHLKLKG